MAVSTRILEIVSLQCKDMETGRPRVFKPGDFENPLHWERLVEESERFPKMFDVRRELVESEEERAVDLSAVPLKKLYQMTREACAEVGAYYGIKDEGQRRSVLIDQIADEIKKQADSKTRLGLDK